MTSCTCVCAWGEVVSLYVYHNFDIGTKITTLILRSRCLNDSYIKCNEIGEKLALVCIWRGLQTSQIVFCWPHLVYVYVDKGCQQML